MFASTNEKEPLLLYNPNNPLNTTNTAKKTRLSPNKATSHIHKHIHQSQPHNIALTSTKNIHKKTTSIFEHNKTLINRVLERNNIEAHNNPSCARAKRDTLDDQPFRRLRNTLNDQPFTRLRYNIKLINTDSLKAHEHTDPKKIHEVEKSIIEDGIKYPIVADKKTNIILDGHHRHNIFKKLKIKNIPVFYVNYMDERIILDSWNSQKLTKQDVINNATSHKLYPIKTTKHMLKTNNGQTHISQTLPRINLNITQLIDNTPTIKRL